MTETSTELFQLTLLDSRYIAAAGSAVESGATGVGLDQSDAVRLRCVAEDLCRLVVDATSFDTAERATIEVALERRVGGVAVVVTDRGMPSELSEHPDHTPTELAELIHQGFATSLAFSYSARGGNRAEIVKDLTYPDVLDQLESEGPVDAEPVPDDGAGIDFEIRSMEPDDVWAVARLFYRCYRDTYQHPIVYEPAKLAEHVSAGLHRGSIAVLPDGTVAAHVGMTVTTPDDPVGMAGMLVVDPRFRGAKLGSRVTGAMAERLVAEGMVGLYAGAVTKHVASQKMATASGGREVAVLLAKLPGGVIFEGFEQSASTHRESVVWTYQALVATPTVPVYPPARWRSIIEKTYARVGLDRELAVSTPRVTGELPAHTKLDIAVSHVANDAVLTITDYGKDFREVVRRNLLQLCVNRIDVVYIDLPLSDPLTAQLGSGLNELGFFLAGVLPQYGDGDVLRLQYLNNYEVAASELVIATEWGQELADGVLASMVEARERDNVRSRSRAYLAPLLDALDDD